MENIITVENDGADKRTDAFAAFMSDVENEMNSLARKDSSFYKKCNAFDLEKCAVETMKMVAPKSEFNPDDINLVSGQSFPDIVLSKQVFGVEVKSTQANHWTSTGSSIVESTRNDYVQYIYMLFGKLGGSMPEFRCKPYEDCLYDIAVTHSPRYLIDMNLKKSDTIFSKMHTTYDEFRNEEHPIKTVVNYYKTQLPPGERLWWMGDDEPEKPTGNIILRFWNYLEMKEKDQLKLQGYCLFPEIVSNRSDKFNRLAFWLTTEKRVVCPNVRDLYTSGGKSDIYIKEHKITVPQILLRIYDNLNKIKEMLQQMKTDQLAECWGCVVNDKFETWKEQLIKNNNSQELKKILGVMEVS